MTDRTMQAKQFEKWWLEQSKSGFRPDSMQAAWSAWIASADLYSPSEAAVVWGPEQQDYPNGLVYRKGSSTGATLPPQPSSTEAVQRDAERLDYLERRWMDGVHLEVCHKGGGDHPLKNAKMAVTLYIGSKQYDGETVRAAIDAARTAPDDEAKT